MTVDLWRRRDLFDDEHEAFRETVRQFLSRQVVDHVENWDRQADVPREVWLAAGRQGLLGLNVPEQYGGGGTEDYRFRVAMIEACARVPATSLAAGFAAQTDIMLPYVIHLATPEQSARWLPRLATGEYIGAIAMTEPGTGSDLQGITTSARQDGDDWVLNGAKTFITNGIHADLVVVVARTGGNRTGGSSAFSLFMVEDGTAGFTRGRKLDKVGLKALNRNVLDPVDAAKAKWWATEMHKRVVDRCVQLFGGYGYMLEYPIARAYADTRITTIFGGTTEIMKIVVARAVLGVR
jgi:alkylation response protein AidB-like acyl-CoA dehydrogenase